MSWADLSQEDSAEGQAASNTIVAQPSEVTAALNDPNQVTVDAP
jgi:hypothetical protein